MADPITVAEIIDRTTAYFQQKGIDTARLDAQLLIGHALKKNRLQLYLQFDYPLNEQELAAARELVRRRAAREPVAYIIAEKEFSGRAFKVSAGVLIPRPDTEILVDQVQEQLGADIHGRILEFGIGSGAIAITLAANNPGLHVIATEMSDAAAKIASENAAAHGVSDRVDIRIQPDFAGLAGPFRAIVSNPPYIAQEEEPSLAPEVAHHEPREALFAADNGLHWYKFLAAQAAQLLESGGLLAVEIGHTQRAAIEEIFRAAGLTEISTKKDLARRDRVITGRMPSNTSAP